jgi:cell division protease FtsH
MDLKNAKHQDIIKKIHKRQKTLKWASKELKKHFVGLDKIIDKIIKDIEAWYVMPELLTRPVIICLWGPTGVGKTDLVRRLVSLLSFHDRFCEIEMMNKGGQYGWHHSISGILSNNPKIQSGEPSILLLDEIQNFRTIDDKGHELNEYKFRDVWGLLSDGKLPFEVEVDYLMQLLWEYEERDKQGGGSGNRDETIPLKTISKAFIGEGNKDVPDDIHGEKIEDEDLNKEKEVEAESPVPDDISKDHGDVESAVTFDDYEDEEGDNYWSLKRFKTVLRLTEPLSEIAKWDNRKKRMVIMERLQDDKLYKPVDYTKCLIFVSGNLDEAYKFTKNTEEVDLDADIFHELSLKISILDIKSSLKERFKPEQIARFGNMQIIYPSLSKASYETIIKRRLAEITNHIYNNFGIKVNMDESINGVIYDNGVFPTQGTRPVFSTISEIVESSMSIFLLKAFMARVRSLTLKYEKNRVKADIGGKSVGFVYKGAVDRLKSDRNKNMDRRALHAVHEAGHAVAYVVLHKVAPPQMTAQPAAQELGGFICLHQNCGAQYLLEQKMTIMLAGGEAEKFIFGEESYTYSSKDDLLEATRLIGQMIKRYGMGDYSSFMMKPNEVTDLYRTDVESADASIEKSIERAQKRAQDIFKDNIGLFMETVDALLTNQKVNPEDFKKICANNGLKIKIRKSEEVICDNYLKKYENFRKNVSGNGSK